MALFSGIKTAKNGTYYISGQLPDDVAAPLEEQAAQALAHVEALIKEAGYSKESMLRIDLFTTDIEHIDQINAAYERFVSDIEVKPTRNAFGVTGLVRGAAIEANCIGEA